MKKKNGENSTLIYRCIFSIEECTLYRLALTVTESLLMLKTGVSMILAICGH